LLRAACQSKIRAMRPIAIVAALVFVTRGAHADAPSLGAAIGAGAQGDATYGALELRLDAAWPGVRLGLGARGVWDDGVFRRADWASVADVVTVVRDLELVHEVDGATLALAAGRLAPAHVGHLVDGYRAALDDRWRTGVRTALWSHDVDAEAEIDDVLDPALVAVAARWRFAPPWGAQLAIAADPGATTAIEAGVVHRYEAERARLDVGGSIVAELSLGASAVVYGDATAERDGVRWTVRGDVRAGTGSVGSLFGPLYRVERLGVMSLYDRARRGELSGAGTGVAVGAAIPAGWLELGARARPGLGGLVVASGGAPMGRWLQAAAWLAASRRDAAGAAELRVAWAARLYSALQVARIYQLDAMPTPAWSVVAWFGASSSP
jgi:hypothetical protein